MRMNNIYLTISPEAFTSILVSSLFFLIGVIANNVIKSSETLRRLDKSDDKRKDSDINMKIQMEKFEKKIDEFDKKFERKIDDLEDKFNNKFYGKN